MSTNYTFLADLAKLQEIPPDGTLSRTIYQDEYIRAVLFTFDAGQELSEHTASVPAIIHIIEGDARLTLGRDSMEVTAGAWAHLPPHLPHGLYAKTQVVMLLLMLKSVKPGD